MRSSILQIIIGFFLLMLTIVLGIYANGNSETERRKEEIKSRIRLLQKEISYFNDILDRPIVFASVIEEILKITPSNCSINGLSINISTNRIKLEGTSIVDNIQSPMETIYKFMNNLNDSKRTANSRLVSSSKRIHKKSKNSEVGFLIECILKLQQYKDKINNFAALPEDLNRLSKLKGELEDKKVNFIKSYKNAHWVEAEANDITPRFLYNVESIIKCERELFGDKHFGPIYFKGKINKKRSRINEISTIFQNSNIRINTEEFCLGLCGRMKTSLGFLKRYAQIKHKDLASFDKIQVIRTHQKSSVFIMEIYLTFYLIYDDPRGWFLW